MAEILDNQEVTTTTLNNIAIDLGATSFNGFTENKFGADALNDITKALVSKGVTQGGNKCAPYLSNGTLYINTGTIIFESGAKIRITSPQAVTTEPSTYVYALNDTTRNIAQIVAADSFPTTGDFVTLAYLDENSVASDRRQWAQSSVLLATTSYPQITAETEKLSSGEHIIEVPIDWTGWTRLIYEGYIQASSSPSNTLYATDVIPSDDYVELMFNKRTWTVYAKRNGANLILKIIVQSGYAGSYKKTFTLI